MFWFTIATCSALLSAASAIIQKKILFRLNALEFSFLVSAVIIVLSSFIPFTVDITTVPLSTIWIIIGKSVLGATAFLLVMLSLQHNQISSALPLLGLTPAVTAMLAWVVLGEALKDWEWIGVALVIVGAYLLDKNPSDDFFQPLKKFAASQNHYYIFGAVLLFAVSSVADKLLVGNYKTDPLIVLFFQHIVYFLLFAFLLLFRSVSFKNVFSKGKEQFVFIALVALLTLAYRFTQLEATKLAPVALVLAVKRTSILYASFFGGKLFSEERLKIKLLGAALIVTAGFIILRNVG